VVKVRVRHAYVTARAPLPAYMPTAIFGIHVCFGVQMGASVFAQTFTI